LCVGGYGIYGSQHEGIVLLMRGMRGMENGRFRWIQDNMLWPFINKCSLDYDQFDWKAVVGASSQVPEQHRTTYWCNGNASQIDTIVSNEGIEAFSKHGVIANKHNPSRTGSERSQDLGCVFPSGKALNKLTTAEHIPYDINHFKGKVEMIFVHLHKTNGI
jgi:hypothetical protein